MPESSTTVLEAEAPGRGPGSAGRKPVDILVVDDSPSKLLALESALAPLGENVVCARSGRAALSHLLAREFATVILDVNMPDLDGFATARMIRSRPRSSTTPIIFVSAVNMDEADTQQGYSLGAVDYIFAPIVAEVIRAKVSVFVELHRKTEEARLHAERLEERTRELERSQRELRMSEHMASIGTLCAGLGHDMGNLLFPVSVWLDRLHSDKFPEDMREGVESLRTCVQYLRKLTSGLRLVSLNPAQENGDGRVVLGEWVEDVGPILRNALPRGVTLDVDIPDVLPAVRIAPHRLAQAAFNLVQNAGEAVRDRPNSVVRLWAAFDPAGKGVRVGVTDYGPGMSREVLTRCLDPFFTTKTRGISTGLGLSLVHGIVRSAGSRLEIESTPERGTTFWFTLQPIENRRSAMPLAIVTVDEPRSRAIAIALLRAAGCELAGELPEEHHGPCVWITGPADDLAERVEAFTAGGDARRVILLGDRDPDVEGVHTTNITEPGGLASELRQFLAEVRA